MKTELVACTLLALTAQTEATTSKLTQSELGQMLGHLRSARPPAGAPAEGDSGDRPSNREPQPPENQADVGKPANLRTTWSQTNVEAVWVDSHTNSTQKYVMDQIELIHRHWPGIEKALKDKEAVKDFDALGQRAGALFNEALADELAAADQMFRRVAELVVEIELDVGAAQIRALKAALKATPRIPAGFASPSQRAYFPPY